MAPAERGKGIANVSTRIDSARRFIGREPLLRFSVVGLALVTAYIHSTLGGTLFLLNAAGYVALAIALAAPVAIADRYRWLARLGLLGFTAATIVGWVLVGPRFPLAYFTKGIEVALIALLAVDILVAEGTPGQMIHRARAGLAVARRRLGVAGA